MSVVSADFDSWMGSYRGMRSTPPPVTRLLGSDTYTNENSEVLPFRSTTYDIQQVAPAVFAAGAVYVGYLAEKYQLSAEGFAAMGGASVSQLYTMGYRSYITQQRKEATDPLLPCAPPDFDGSAPPAASTVANYVRGLGIAYNDNRSRPTPFQIYQHIILEAMEGLETTTDAFDPNTGNCLADAEDTMSHAEAVEVGEDTYAAAMSYDPYLQSEAASISLTLATLHTLEPRIIGVLSKRLAMNPEISMWVFPEAIASTLAFFDGAVRSGVHFMQGVAQLCTLVGLLISPRGDIKEVMSYLNTLEYLSNNSTSTCIIKSLENITRLFTFHATAITSIASPIDCFQVETPPPNVQMPEGEVVQCFCTSRNGEMMAACTETSIYVYNSGTGGLLAERELPEGCRVWNVVFSGDGRHIICTDMTGLKHTMYESDLSNVEQSLTTEVSIPVDFADGTIIAQGPPLLPSGSNSSLFLMERHGPLISVCNESLRKDISICAHVYKDFVGVLVTLGADGDDELSVSITAGIVYLSQGKVTSSGAIMSTSPWNFVYVRWNKGVWALTVNSTVIELRGPRSGQPKDITIQNITCLDGVGHIGSLAVWSCHGSSSGVSRYCQERSLSASVEALINVPLDEGQGMWVKETVSAASFPISETSFVWDALVRVPCLKSSAPCSPSQGVRLSAKRMLEGRVLISAFKSFIILPSDVEGADDVILDIDRVTNTIVRVHRCPSSCFLYSILWNESELLRYHQRFSTLSSAKLHMPTFKRSELAQSNLLDSYPTSTVQWFLQEWYVKIYTQSIEFCRIPLEHTPLSLSSLVALTDSLKGVTAQSNKLRVLAILSLVLVHLKMLPIREAQLSKIAQSIKESCSNCLLFFTEDIIVRTSTELRDVASLRSLTFHDRVAALLDSDVERVAVILRTTMTKESLSGAVHHIVATCPDKLVGITQRLIQMCRAEEAGGSDQCITHLLLWYVLSVTKALVARHMTTEISQMLEILLLYSVECKDSLCTSQRWCAIQTGSIPLLIIVSKLVPVAFTPTIERLLFQLLAELRETPGKMENVSFSTRAACNVFPPSKAPERMWRFTLEFTGASSVAVVTEPTTSPMTVLHSNCSSPEPTSAIASAEHRIIKMTKGPLIFYGVGQNAFTAIAEYEFSVDVSWATLLRECVHHVLVSYARHLTEKPPSSDNFVPPLVRHGLTTEVLKAHGLTVPGREQFSTFALRILTNEEDGKDYVDQVCKAMRGSMVSSMRPAIQALLSILIHCGATTQQAEDELKLRWFSGEWGSKLQGPTKLETATFLQETASWLIHSVIYQPDLPSMSFRRSSADRRFDVSLNCSRSISDRYGSMNSRRSLMKSTSQYDTLDQLKTLLSREVSAKELENVLVQRTRVSLAMSHGLSIISRLLAYDASPINEGTIIPILLVLWQVADVNQGAHFMDAVVGAGTDLEADVRTTFHSVLSRCQHLLLGTLPKSLSPLSVLSEAATNGKAAMLLLAILSHPWDATDCEIFNANFSKDNDLLAYLEGTMNIPLGNMTLTSPWRMRRNQSTEVGELEERSLRAELMGTADLNSLSRLYPNDFSNIIPRLQSSRSEDGVLIEKGSSTGTLLRADEGWPLSWKEGVPRVFYFEVRVSSPIGSLEVGLFFSQNDLEISGVSLPYHYNSSGETHGVSLPTFGEGDIIGCGVVATNRRVFFTLNGTFLAYVGVVSETHDVLFPTIRFGESPFVKVLVNFGTIPFAYDFRRLHPSLTLERGPTWYRLASTAECVLHYITTRACTVQEAKRTSTRLFLSHCCEVVCRNVNKVTSSLMHLGVGASANADSGTRIKQAVIFSVAEYSIMLLISTMRQIVIGDTIQATLPEVVGQMIFDAVSVLMLLPLHTVQISTICLLPEVIPHVSHFPDSATSNNLVQTLFDHATCNAADSKDLIPFVPMWCNCDPCCMSIVNVQLASVLPESQRSIVLGSVLPRTGVVSFSVSISRRNMSKGHSLKGGYYIGVSVASFLPISPSSNTQGWKTVTPSIVWAIHDTSPQLPYATNPTVKPNNFQRTFGNDDVIRVVVDRDKRIIDFYRDDEFLKSLFSDIPIDVDLVPFAQMYNDDASAVIHPGEMTAPISAPTLLSAASVDVLRAMITLEPFQGLVTTGVCKELDMNSYPKVTLALFNSIPDPRVLQLRSAVDEELLVSVSRVSDLRCKFSVGGEVNYEHLYNMRAPANPKVTCSFDSWTPTATLGGLSKCVERLVLSLRRVVVPLITMQALSCLELEERQRVVYDEKERWDFLFYGLRMGSFINIHRASQSKSLITPLRVQTDFTFSAELSHPAFSISPHYCGRLATVPSAKKNLSTPYIAIAEPPVPQRGTFSIRCQFIRGHSGMILGGGYYFGVCTASFNWKRKDLGSATPEVWAIHDMDDTMWRLRHLIPTTTFPVLADPRCIMVSGDIIRLEINRDERTMYAYRKPMNAEEVCLGPIFDNLPTEPLYPFVHMYNLDAVAVLLPSNSDQPAVRLTEQKPVYSILPVSDRRNCDGCAALHVESRLSQTFYKCNECADYALCKKCFDLCMHCYHSFTELGAGLFVHSISPPKLLKPAMEVVIPSTTCMYLRSAGCRMHEDQMNCVVDAIEDGAYAVWGMVSKAKGQFSVVVDTLDGEQLSTEHSIFIGVGGAEDIMRLSKEKLRSKCFSGSSSIVAFCSDPTLRRRMDNESRFPYGFKKGSRITLDVDLTKRTVSIIRDWIVVGTRPADFSKGPSSDFPLCCFIVFGKRNVRASILLERSPTIMAAVEETNGSVVKVATPDKRIRFVTAENCRLPLRPCRIFPPQIGQLGYTYIKNQMVQCQVLTVGQSEVVLQLAHENSGSVVLPMDNLLVSVSQDTPEERLISKAPREVGPSLEQGFVVSRLLLILSCLCESDVLSPLLMEHTVSLVSMVKGLASVNIENDAPLDFLSEIRKYITLTASCMRSTNLNQTLNFFVPTLGIDSRKRRFKPMMLVRTVDSPDSPVYRVLERRGETLAVENTATSERAEFSHRRCIPVKQTAGLPWYELENGLPCSLLEHTTRVLKEEHASTNVSIGGQWQGEFLLSGRPSVSIEMKMAEDSGLGEAAAYFTPQPLTYLVIYEHHRYQRVVKMCLVRHDAAFPELENPALTFTEKVALIKRETRKLSEVVLHVTAGLDAEGLRMTGVCRTEDGKMGTFTANWPSRITFASVTTAIRNVEPLPDCVDTDIPVHPQTELCDTMRRLIILLARHLYLVISNKVSAVSKEFIEQISLYATHPLADRLVIHFIGVPHLFFMVSDACQLIVDPNTKPWDAANLANLLNKTFLLRPEVSSAAPVSLVWDALHAVVAAAHRCGSEYQPDILRSITKFVEHHSNYPQHVYTQLFPALFAYINQSALDSADDPVARKIVSAGVDLILTDKVPMQSFATNIPVMPLKCLVDIAKSIEGGVQLPKIVEGSDANDGDGEEVHPESAFGDLKGNDLKLGKMISSRPAGLTGMFYFEVVLSDRLAPTFAVGWGTRLHCDIPTQHVGCDTASFAFNGTEISTKDMKEDYMIFNEIVPGSVIGCMLNMDERTTAWSINGISGPFMAIPIILGDECLYAFASIGTGNGMQIRLRASEFEYVPDGYTDVCRRYARVLMRAYDSAARSSLPVRGVTFYSQLASYLSDVEEHNDEIQMGNSLSASVLLRRPRDLYLPKYSVIMEMSDEEIDQQSRVIAAVESCMATAEPFVDLDDDTVCGALSMAFLYLKPAVRRSFRLKLLVNLPGVEKVRNPPPISIRVTELYSTLPRIPDVALQHTVLAQLYKQIGSFTDAQWSLSPLFKVNLYISGSGHAPIDMGGPYRQVWTFVAEEIMRHPDMCYPHSDFHRNPLFAFVNNSQRVALVPDSMATSPSELALFNFFGKIMGHAARAKLPLDIDFSTFFWKFLVDDVPSISDYYQYVDSVVQTSMEDDNFLLSGVAEELIPGFAEHVHWVEEENIDDDKIAQWRRSIAENCLVHSMDEQLNAIRNGLWSTLPRRVARCLSWRDLEKLVCGESNPSVAELQRYIRLQVNSMREKFFWSIVEEMSAEQKASFLCFASGQRRLPLIRPINIQENAESQNHLPRAQSCSSLVTIPMYTTLDAFRQKLLTALSHQTEMELA